MPAHVPSVTFTRMAKKMRAVRKTPAKTAVESSEKALAAYAHCDGHYSHTNKIE